MRVAKGYLGGQEFELEDELGKVMSSGLISCNPGNPACMMAMAAGGYTNDNLPFYYGKVENLGYVVSHEDLYGTPQS